MRRRLLAFPLALLGTVALATTVAAGGWAQVTITDQPTDPAAVGGTTIGFQVLQHGVTAVSWPRITVIATNPATGAVVQSAAQAQGPTGHYVATVIFPAEGSWTITFNSRDLVMEGAATMAVRAAAATAPTYVSTAAPIDPVPVGLAGLLVLAVVGGGALAIHGHRAGRRAGRAAVSG